MIKLYGICLQTNELESIVMEYMNYGDLLAFLRQSRNENVFYFLFMFHKLQLFNIFKIENNI